MSENLTSVESHVEYYTIYFVSEIRRAVWPSTQKFHKPLGTDVGSWPSAVIFSIKFHQWNSQFSRESLTSASPIITHRRDPSKPQSKPWPSPSLPPPSYTANDSVPHHTVNMRLHMTYEVSWIVPEPAYDTATQSTTSCVFEQRIDQLPTRSLRRLFSWPHLFRLRVFDVRETSNGEAGLQIDRTKSKEFVWYFQLPYTCSYSSILFRLFHGRSCVLKRRSAHQQNLPTPWWISSLCKMMHYLS